MRHHHHGRPSPAACREWLREALPRPMAPVPRRQLKAGLGLCNARVIRRGESTHPRDLVLGIAECTKLAGRCQTAQDDRIQPRNPCLATQVGAPSRFVHRIGILRTQLGGACQPCVGAVEIIGFHCRLGTPDHPALDGRQPLHRARVARAIAQHFAERRRRPDAVFPQVAGRQFVLAVFKQRVQPVRCIKPVEVCQRFRSIGRDRARHRSDRMRAGQIHSACLLRLKGLQALVEQCLTRFRKPVPSGLIVRVKRKDAEIKGDGASRILEQMADRKRLSGRVQRFGNLGRLDHHRWRTPIQRIGRGLIATDAHKTAPQPCFRRAGRRGWRFFGLACRHQDRQQKQQ